MSITIEAKDAGKLLKKLDGEARKRIRLGMIRGAERGRGILVRATPTDTGQARAAWKVFTSIAADIVARLGNDAPHIGIIEGGARPHPVSDVGMLALERWALRHPEVLASAQPASGRMMTNEEAARAVAAGIAWKLRTKGQEPTYFVKNSLPKLRKAMAAEVARELRALMKSPPGVE